MFCPYGIENCSHSKCFVCGECTNGSQIHRSCFKNEIPELSAKGESLPTKEEEDEMSEVQPSTPLSATALFEDPEEAELGEYFKFVKVSRNTTDEDDLVANPPDIHQYLSEYVKREDFEDMYELSGHSMVYNCGPYRLRTPVIVHDHKINHLMCGEDIEEGLKGVVTVHSTSREELVDMIKDDEDYFFCNTCGYFLFSELEFMSDRVMTIPDTYPKCEDWFMTACRDEDNIAVVHVSAIPVTIVITNEDNFFTPEPKRRKIHE